MDKIIINLNDKVRFKLTDLGREIYYHHVAGAIKLGAQLTPEYPREDAEGYSSMQIWEFLALYGPHIGITKQNVIEPLNLIVDVPDSKIPAAKPEEAQDLDLEREFQQAMEWLRQETIDNQRDLINRQRAFIDLLLRKLKEEEPDDGH